MKDQISNKRREKSDIIEQMSSFARKRPDHVIWGTIVITLLLLVPMLLMAPDERASNNPGGEVFDTGKDIDDRMPSSVHTIFFVVEAADGDMLKQEPLWELYQNEKELRNSEIGQELLYTRYDIDSGRMSFGVYTIADAVQSFFLMNPDYGVTLENAPNDLVKLAVHYILMNPGSSGLVESFSEKSTSETRSISNETITSWNCPALVFLVNMNNSRIEKEEITGFTTAAGGPKHQEVNRDIQEILRGKEDNYALWGIAIDMDLEGEEEGLASFPLIILAMLIIVVVIYHHFRDKQITLLTVLGLGMLIVWLKGFSNLIGLRSSLTLDIIVPVSILVLGVDYAIHSIHRYQEELDKGTDPQTSLGNGIVGVGGALVLAMLSTVVAFLSNVTSGIEEVIGFGIAASFAIVAALLIMGFFVPTLKMKLDMMSLGKTSVGKGKNGKKGLKGASSHGHDHDKHQGVLIEKLVGAIVDRKEMVMVFVIIISAISGNFAMQLEGKLEAKDMFDPDSDFVISLDKSGEHIGDTGGEDASIYIEGDLSDPATLAAIEQLAANMEDDEWLARDLVNDQVDVEIEIFDFLEAVLESNVATQRVEAANPGMNLSDTNNDQIPDSPEQIRAIYGYIVKYGIPLNETITRYEPGRVRESLYHDPTGANEDATVVTVLVTTIEPTEVKESRKELENDMKALKDVESISHYSLAGAQFEREVTLDSYTAALNSSIVLAVILCFIILAVAFRSVKYATATIIPVVLVAVWLYGFMYLAGFNLNYVTVTIAAISIGVGVDYSVHITSRFRQDLEAHMETRKALSHSAGQAGCALFGSAMSTVFGFAVIALAPMPMFAAFGLLTALMILMAFAASIFVLPSMLMFVAESDMKKLAKNKLPKRADIGTPEIQ